LPDSKVARSPIHGNCGNVGNLKETPRDFAVFDPENPKVATNLESDGVTPNGHDPEAINRLLSEAANGNEQPDE
jgi:hypothetical protein